MQLFKIALALLPALALAKDELSTTTQTSPTTLYKTLTLSEVHTDIVTPTVNSTTPTPTPTPSSSFSTPLWSTSEEAELTSTEINTVPEPTTSPTTVEEGAASALSANRLAFAGAVGVAIAILI